MNFEEIPNYYEVNYNNYLYVISKFSFIPGDDKIYFNWSKIHLWDEKLSIKETFIEGEIIVDAYSVSNNDVKDYIEKREELYKEIEKYYKSKGSKVSRAALGSQDGEYISISSESILFLLDPSAIEIWEKSIDVEDFIYNYKKFIA